MEALLQFSADILESRKNHKHICCHLLHNSLPIKINKTPNRPPHCNIKQYISFVPSLK